MRYSQKQGLVRIETKKALAWGRRAFGEEIYIDASVAKRGTSGAAEAAAQRRNNLTSRISVLE